MPDLKTSISLSETEFKKGTYLPGLTSKYTQNGRVKPEILWFSVARIKLRIHGTYFRIDHHMRTT